ncbi:MAG: hypothetical protein JNL53_13965 [Cyclobacteriaceae bacterium]|nr:hypothetical protein [Cyclobacteriaceae bacterium]
MKATVYLLGAGASHGYYKSKANVHPPLAKNYFSTFYNLLISGDLEVKIGFIANYIRDTRGILPVEQPLKFNEDIESIFAEIDRKLRASFDRTKKRKKGDVVDSFSYMKAYDQFVFWFAHVLNEIQNGDICPIYKSLVNNSNKADTFITFNWDTLLDRALFASGKWFPDDGYNIDFTGLLEKTWREPVKRKSKNKLLKLHGSTNWFGPYMTRHLQTGEQKFVSDPDNVYNQWCLIDGSLWFDTYKDRWRPDYEPFSYYFTPNDPITGLPLMPVIVPPSATKDFSVYKELFEPVWSEAESKLAKTSRLVIAGYSFPLTDTHAFKLLKCFLNSGGKTIEIIDLYPEEIGKKIEPYLGKNDCKVILHKKTLAEYLEIGAIKFKAEESALFKSNLEWLELAQEIDEKKSAMLDILWLASIHDKKLDIVTSDKKKYLNCRLDKEFMLHLLGAFHSANTINYRLLNIPFKPKKGKQIKLALENIDKLDVVE